MEEFSVTREYLMVIGVACVQILVAAEAISTNVVEADRRMHRFVPAVVIYELPMGVRFLVGWLTRSSGSLVLLYISRR